MSKQKEKPISQLPHNSGDGFSVRSEDGRFISYVIKPIRQVPIEKEKK